MTGGKDGIVSLWDSDFKPLTKVNLTSTNDGYKGKQLAKVVELPT